MTQAPTTTTEDTVMLEEMFVQIARTVTSDQATLTLQDVSPSTLYFSDRPERVVGHMTTEQFIAQWTEGPNSFAEDPPNAVLSYVGTGADIPSDAVVVLRDPVATADSLTYSIEVLDGTVPGVGTGHSVHRPLRPPAEPGVPGRHEPPRPAPRPSSLRTADRPSLRAAPAVFVPLSERAGEGHSGSFH